VPGRAGFDYAVVRLVPRVELEEFLNVGVILHAPTRGFLGCCLYLNVERVRVFADVDVAAVSRHLDGFKMVCEGVKTAGPIAAMPATERFHWLVAPRSTMIQSSPVHGGVCEDPAIALRELFERRVQR
jgi:hypothetical protein